MILVCALGGHEWERSGRGRPPKNCPEHATPAEAMAALRHKTFYVPHPRERKQRPPSTPRTPEEIARASSEAARARWATVSRDDRSKAARAAARARWGDEPRPARVVEEKPCLYCGAILRGSNRKACGSAACRKRFNADRQAKYGHVRRVKIRGDSETEIFEKQEIFDRDGWICGICELPVDPMLVFPDPGYATLDHIIPIASGGAHTRENTQCAHLYCNSVKGARLTA